jgi:hypothetical protein
MLSSGIVGLTFNRAKGSLPGEPTLKLCPDFVGASFFQGISATRGHDCKGDGQQDRQGLHLLILRGERGIAMGIVKSLNR